MEQNASTLKASNGINLKTAVARGRDAQSLSATAVRSDCAYPIMVYRLIRERVTRLDFFAVTGEGQPTGECADRGPFTVQAADDEPDVSKSHLPAHV
jgi:hypothetical protein